MWELVTDNDRQYYETAANLGDTGMPSVTYSIQRPKLTIADAMNEVAWCYLEGFGTKKDKVSLPHPFTTPSYQRRRPLGTLTTPTPALFPESG